MRPVNRGTKPVHITLSGRSQSFQAQDYGFFMGQMIARLGEYCSFCEVALGANLAIEHIVSKSANVNLETDWDNLLLACPNCNSRKGSTIKNDQDKQQYYWPDTSYPNFNTFSMLEYYLDTSSTLPIVLVRYRPGSLTYANFADQTIVNRTIDLVKLNNYVPADNDEKQSDRRVRNRTRTWEIAVSMASKLSGYYSRYTNTSNDAQAETDAAADPAIALLKRQITMAALAAGFWSVWMTVFGTGTFINDTVRAALLQELFITPFPGTRYP